MVNASFEGLTAALNLCGSQISGELLMLALKTAIAFRQMDEREILKNSARLLKSDRSWHALRECVLSLSISNPSAFSPVIFTYLIRTDSRKTLSPYALAISNCLVERFQQRLLGLDAATALFMLLFDHTPHVIEATLENAIAIKGLERDFKLMVVGLGLKTNPQVSSLGGVPRYLLSVFNKGGMHLIGNLLLSKPQIAIALLSKGAAKAAILLAFKEIDNVRAYIWFIQLSLLTMEHHNKKLGLKFAPVVYRFCVKVIDKWGKDPMNGKMIVWHCIRVIKDGLRLIGGSLESLFGESDRAERESVIQMITDGIESEIQNRKMQSLVAFSANERGKRQSEWSVLEIDESD
jgi:hypothetical protein